MIPRGIHSVHSQSATKNFDCSVLEVFVWLRKELLHTPMFFQQRADDLIFDRLNRKTKKWKHYKQGSVSILNLSVLVVPRTAL
jgi:hypothetical protein